MSQKHSVYCKTMSLYFVFLSHVKSTKEGEYNKNVFLKPYATENDSRSDCLENTIFHRWKQNIIQ